MKTAVDRSAGAIALFMGCFSLREFYRLYPQHVSLLGGDHLFPGILGAGLAASGIWLLLFPGKPHRDGAADAGMEPEAVAQASDKCSNGASAGSSTTAATYSLDLKAIAIPALLLLYTFLIRWTGYPAGTLVAGVLLFRLMGTRSWPLSVLNSLLLTAALYLVFAQWLHTPLPAGQLSALWREVAR